MVVTAITTALLAESSADVSNMHATALLVLMPQILSDMGNRSENACMFGVSAPLTGFAIVVAVMTIFASGRGGSTVFCHSFAVTGFSAVPSACYRYHDVLYSLEAAPQTLRLSSLEGPCCCTKQHPEKVTWRN